MEAPQVETHKLGKDRLSRCQNTDYCFIFSVGGVGSLNLNIIRLVAKLVSTEIEKLVSTEIENMSS